jgi:heavy metal sensor kinase
LSVFLLRSVRFRLTFWYALTLAVILAASALFSYHYFSYNLRQQVDAELMKVAEQLDQHRQEAFAGEHSSAEHCVALRDVIHEYNWDDYILLRDATLQPACYSENLLKEELPFGPVARQQTRWLHPHLETVEFGDGQRLQLLSYPLIQNERLVGVAQIGNSLGIVQQTLDELRLIYLIVGPFAIFWLCSGCWFLAEHMIAPILEVTEASQGINAENLARRLPSSGHRDELSLMVGSLNLMLERLESSFRKVRQFSGDASHELRTPLTILRGETEVALRWAKSADEFRDVLQSNMEEIDRMERIIESLLTLAKSEAGELTLELKELSLSDLAQELYLQGRILGEPKNISVDLRLEVDQEIRIHGDELRLRQMFLNLITNGIKYNREGGRMQIVLAVDGDEARVDIEDSGIGIPDYHLSHIFDRFYRVDKARNRMDGGTGLGLSIVRWIAEVHGGRISVESTPDVGSTFTVYLPVSGPTEDQVPRQSIRH